VNNSRDGVEHRCFQRCGTAQTCGVHCPNYSIDQQIFLSLDEGAEVVEAWPDQGSITLERRKGF
jgi:hypothetical protein